MGQRAFAEHRDRVVPRELLVGNGEVGNGIAAARRWYRGWDAANLADSSDPDPDALVSPGELDKHGRWVDPDDEFGHDLDEAAWGAGLPDDGDEDDDNEDRLLAGPSSSHGPGPAPRNSLGKRFADRLRRR
jgi:hypothetical protein